MPFQSNIVKSINDEFEKGLLKNFGPVKLYGISQAVVRKDSRSNMETFPGVMCPSGIVCVSPDDSFGVIAYHKVISKRYERVRKSYGDGYQIRCVADMMMVVFLNCKSTKQTAIEAEPKFITHFPQRYYQNHLTRCLIEPTGSHMGAVTLWKQEFPQTPYKLSEQLTMFGVKYKTESIFSPDCVKHVCP